MSKMKKIIKCLFLIFALFFLIKVQAEIVTYEKTFPFANVKTIIAEPSFNILLQERENLTLLKTDLLGNILVSKTYVGIANANIIKQNNNYLLVGKQNNHLQIYVIDEYLRTINTIETTHILPTGDLHLYKDKKEIYILCINNKNLASNSVYKINEDFSWQETSFSAIDNIKEIIKKDYPLLEENVTKKETGIALYESSTYKENTTILVGSINNKGLLTLKDDDKTIDIEDEAYTKYLYTTILNDSILVLATNGEQNALFVFDLTGEKKEEYKQEENLTTSSIIKGQQKIYITTENSVITYNYETILNKEENLYGTLTIEGKLKPYEKIKYQIEPNSGYKIKEVLLKNDQGDLLEVKEESFVLPNTNAYLSVTYEAEVENPNTADPILLIFLGIFLLLGILIKLYKKWNWLK